MAIPRGFSLPPPVAAGRDGLTSLLLSCPADPASHRREEGTCPPGLGSHAAEVVAAAEISALSPMVPLLKPQEKQGRPHTKSRSDPTEAVRGPLLPQLCATCGCCDSCVPRLSFSPLLGRRRSVWGTRTVLRVL